ncbi:tail fiber protein [Escherichia coli]
MPVPWPSATPPGWLKCNGAAFSSEMYPSGNGLPANKYGFTGEFIAAG